MKMKRKIVRIDEEKCDGCGLCVPACAEGAIEIIDGKARLISEKYCDGLGACLGECPQDAITIEEREAESFDEKAVEAHLHSHTHAGFECPSARIVQLTKVKETDASVSLEPQLSHWPVQLTLVPSSAPYLKEADLLIAADCVPFAYPDFHHKLLAGKVVLVGCPKLDDANFYIEKLAEIFAQNNLKSITVAHMEVPCCFGLDQIVRQALARSEKNIPIEETTIGIDGTVKEI